MRTLVFVLGGLLVVMFGVAMYYYGKSQNPVATTAPAPATEPAAIDPATLSNAATADMPGREVVSRPGSVFSNPKPPAWQPDDFEQKLVVSNVEYDARFLAPSRVRGILQNTSKHTVYAGIIIQVRFLDADFRPVDISEHPLDGFVTPDQVMSFNVKALQPMGASRTDVVVVSANELNVDEFWAE